MPDPLSTQAAQDALLLQIYALLHHYVRRKVDDEQGADDVIQDLALRCLLRLRSGAWAEPPRNLRSYVRSMVRRHLGRLHDRRDGKRLRQVLYAADRVAMHPAWMSPDRVREEADIESCRRRAMGKLPPRARDVYSMIREPGATYRSVAEAAGVPFDTVRTYVAQANQLLRQELHRAGIELTRGPRQGQSWRSPDPFAPRYVRRRPASE